MLAETCFQILEEESSQSLERALKTSSWWLWLPLHGDLGSPGSTPWRAAKWLTPAAGGDSHSPHHRRAETGRRQSHPSVIFPFDFPTREAQCGRREGDIAADPARSPSAPSCSPGAAGVSRLLLPPFPELPQGQCSSAPPSLPACI